MSTLTLLLFRLIRGLGQSLAWLSLLVAGVTFLIVVLRKLGVGSIAAQESVIYMHATLFMLAAAYSLQEDQHVRVDIFYRGFSANKRRWVNVIGHTAFLIPICIMLMISAWDYVAASWTWKEGSSQASGLPGVYLLKTLLLIAPGLWMLQALADIAKWIFFSGALEETKEHHDKRSKDEGEPLC